MKINQENKTIINNLASAYSYKVFFLPVCEADFQNFPKNNRLHIFSDLR